MAAPGFEGGGVYRAKVEGVVANQARSGLLVRVQFIEVPYPGRSAFCSAGA
jgi:hypothetical protein